MARLPDTRELGALPSALSGRPLARYDVSGYARGAAAIAEGLGVLGRGIGRAADGFEEMRRREERTRLDRAKADAGYLVVAQTIRSGMARESDPDVVAQTYPQAFRDAYAGAADTIGDPEAREEWSLAHSAERDGQIAAATDHAETLRRGREVEGVKAQLDQLRITALDSDDEDTRFELMQAGQRLMFALRDNGLIDAAGAKAMGEHWATTYARERLDRMAPDERIKALEQGEGGIAEFVPEETRSDLLRNARVDLTEAQRKVASDAALACYVTNRDIADDVARIEASGRGNDELTPQQIDETLGPEARRAWQARRDDARTIWTQSHDFSTLTDAEIGARVDAAMPADDADPRQRAIFTAVGQRAAAIRNLRRDDPAASVADDPNVRVAAEELDRQKPETMQRLIEARLAAQQRAGIATPAIITRGEMQYLLRPLVEAAKADAETPGGNVKPMQQAQDEVLRGIEQTFGAHAGAVIHQIAESLGVTGAADAPRNEEGEIDPPTPPLPTPVQFKIGRTWNPWAPVPGPLTPQHQRDFWNDIRGPSNAALAMAQIAAKILRDTVLNQQGDDPDKPTTPASPDAPQVGAGAPKPKQAITPPIGNAGVTSGQQESSTSEVASDVGSAARDQNAGQRPPGWKPKPIDYLVAAEAGRRIIEKLGDEPVVAEERETQEPSVGLSKHERDSIAASQISRPQQKKIDVFIEAGDDAHVGFLKRIIKNSDEMQELVDFGRYKKLTVPETMSIRVFSRGELPDGREVHLWLKGLMKPKVPADVLLMEALMNRGLAKIPVESRTIWRGEPAKQDRIDLLRSAMQSGKPHFERGFLSFSRDRNEAVEFTSGNAIDGKFSKGIFLVVRQNKSARKIEKISRIPSEKEFLQPSRTWFYVRRIETLKDGFIEVEIEHLD